METWLLILTIMGSSVPDYSMSVGILMDENTCIVAGKGMKVVMENANPGVSIFYKCILQTIPQDPAA